MSTVEILILTAIGLVVVSSLCFIFFKRKKKVKTKKEEANVGEKKVEQAIKPKVDKKDEEDKEKNKDDDEEAKKEKALEKTPFKIIRKQSEVKINKKALKNGSRNPSITKVFDKEGNRVDLSKEEELQEEIIEDKIDEKFERVSEERFSARDYNISDESSEHEYKIVAPKGSPNRAPIIQDRTNFGSHLHISDDGNMSGIIGTGVKEIIENVDDHSENIEQRTHDMIRNVHKSLFDEMDYLDRYQSFQQDYESDNETPKDKLKNIDAQTLIIAEAISNPKGKRKPQ